jgi:hypothetical protein
VKGEKNPQTEEDTWIWERDDKKEKAAACNMMRMVLELQSHEFQSGSCRHVLHLPSRQHASGTNGATSRRVTILGKRLNLNRSACCQPPRKLSRSITRSSAQTAQDVLSQAIVMRGQLQRRRVGKDYCATNARKSHSASRFVLFFRQFRARPASWNRSKLSIRKAPSARL